MHDFDALRRELFLVVVEILGVYQPLRRVVLLLLLGGHGAAPVVPVQGALLTFHIRFERGLDNWLRLIVDDLLHH